MKIVECVPNFSEGRDRGVIDAIAAAISGTEEVTLLDVDPGAATNRTVMTFIGTPDAAVEAAFRAIACAADRIDMRHHAGAHARLGATDVCPFVPVSGLEMDECVELARRLGRRVGEELGIPVYLYEAAASRPERRNLADVRRGEYEGLAARLADPDWAPDFGPAELNARSGATVIGARQFLIAYNINLNTRDRKLASDIAMEIREQGRIRRDARGKFVRDENGDPVRNPGMFREVKAVGWFIEEFQRAQISINLTDYHVSPPHAVFDAVCRLAEDRGLRVTGSELVGLIPREAVLLAGRHYLERQGGTSGVPESRLVEAAILSLGLNDVKAFDPRERIIEYRVARQAPLASMSLLEFADETSCDSPAPGGGSVAALCGGLAAALTSMVAALTHAKKGMEERRETMNALAREAQEHKEAFLRAIDDDTQAFQAVIEAMRMPKRTEKETAARNRALEAANRGAIEIPLGVLRRAAAILPLIRTVAEQGNPASASDAGVAALCVVAAGDGAYMNVRINLPGIREEGYRSEVREAADRLVEEVRREGEGIRDGVLGRLD
ncbi:MAG: glutamate formimidoyltransferase [Acidobacteriota bacterium]|jgi:glutamate formiminotransferase/formiminotetrahydrofolate cyclodeaminase